VALDIIALMDALNIPKAVIGGFDWGSRTAGIIAALWPERCKALVAVSGYLITNLAANLKPLPPEAEHGWWVPVLLRHRARRRWLPAEHPRLQQAHLENRLTEMELHRRHL